MEDLDPDGVWAGGEAGDESAGGLRREGDLGDEDDGGGGFGFGEGALEEADVDLGFARARHASDEVDAEGGGLPRPVDAVDDGRLGFGECWRRGGGVGEECFFGGGAEDADVFDFGGFEQAGFDEAVDGGGVGRAGGVGEGGGVGGEGGIRQGPDGVPGLGGGGGEAARVGRAVGFVDDGAGAASHGLFDGGGDHGGGDHAEGGEVVVADPASEGDEVGGQALSGAAEDGFDAGGAEPREEFGAAGFEDEAGGFGVSAAEGDLDAVARGEGFLVLAVGEALGVEAAFDGDDGVAGVGIGRVRGGFEGILCEGEPVCVVSRRHRWVD